MYGYIYFSLSAKVFQVFEFRIIWTNHSIADEAHGPLSAVTTVDAERLLASHVVVSRLLTQPQSLLTQVIKRGSRYLGISGPLLYIGARLIDFHDFHCHNCTFWRILVFADPPIFVWIGRS